MQKASSRVVEIDLLRFIAALLVMLFHLTFRGRFFGFYDINYGILADICKYGFMGVDLFFMISGFVIFMSAQGRTPRQFVISRCTRLYPAFWLAVTLTAITCALWSPEMFKPTIPQYLLNLTMLGGFIPYTGIDGVYWTLYVEIIFYIFIFFSLWGRFIQKAEAFAALWLLASTAALFLPVPYRVGYYLLMKWAHYFVAGAMLYRIYQDGFRWRPFLLILWSFCLALILVAPRMESMSDFYKTEFSWISAALYIVIFYTAMTAIALKKITLQKYHALYILLGSLTYPIYLLHHNIGYTIMYNLHGKVDKYILLAWVFIFILSLGYAVTLYEKRAAKALRSLLLRIFP